MNWERRVPPFAEDALEVLRKAVEESGDEDESLSKDDARSHLVADDRFGTPAYGLLILAVPLMVLVGIDPGIPFLSTVAVLGILTTNLLLGIALYRFPERYPEQYEASVFKLGRTGTKVVSITGIATTVVFIVLSVVSSPTGPVVMGDGCYSVL